MFGRLRADGFTNGDIAIVDSVGPVMDRARFRPASLGSSDPDTILVSVSEPVIWSSTIASHMFRYYSRSIAGQPVSFETCTFQEVDSVNGMILGRNLQVLPGKDSICLLGGTSAGTADRHGVVPSETSRLVAIAWGIQFSLTLKVGPNPFDPRESRIPPDILAILPPGSSRFGIVARAESQMPFVKAGGKVYDAVGNVLVTWSTIVLASNPTQAYLVWDGRNEFGRYVGSGTYLLEVSAEDASGASVEKRMKIGVTR